MNTVVDWHNQIMILTRVSMPEQVSQSEYALLNNFLLYKNMHFKRKRFTCQSLKYIEDIDFATKEYMLGNHNIKIQSFV